MGLSVGIVGLPNVGKSTLFNALLKKQQAYVANFPFATIEPNVGVVPVPDERLNELSKLVNNAPIVPATVKFVDIAGLIAGASKGEGLGNKFLSHIRETDAICHVVRYFSDSNIIKSGSVDPKSDFETVKMELDLADIEMTEKHEKKKNDEAELPLFAKKPILIVLNVDEKDLGDADKLEKQSAYEFGVKEDQVIAICAKTEMELSDLNSEEQMAYLKELGIGKSGLERLIQKAFKTLGLMTFLTAGEKEVRAWTIKQGTTAQKAAGVIHTDFEKAFIKAEIVSYEDFIGGRRASPAEAKAKAGWKKVRELGKVRFEGRDYLMQDGDVVEFKVNV